MPIRVLLRYKSVRERTGRKLTNAKKERISPASKSDDGASRVETTENTEVIHTKYSKGNSKEAYGSKDLNSATPNSGERASRVETTKQDLILTKPKILSLIHI